MKLNTLAKSLCAALFAGAAIIASAGPLQLTDVPADPAWVVHIDCDGLRSTSIGQYLLSEMDKPQAQAKLGAIQAMGRKLELPTSDPNAAIFRLSKLVRLQIGETQHRLAATLSLEAKDEEVAKNMISIGQGLIGLMKMQTEKPEAVKLAQALVLNQEGAAVSATLSLPADEAIGLMKAGAEKKARRH